MITFSDRTLEKCLYGNKVQMSVVITQRYGHKFPFPFPFQYDAVPIQSSVVLCSCSSPSMARNQADTSTPSVISTCGSRQGSNVESTAAESRCSSNSLQQHTGQQPPQPRKKRPDDFKFGKILGEGSFSTVNLPFMGTGRYLR